MNCPGLHCPGCGDGGQVVLYGGGIVAAALAAEWVAAHAWEVLAVTAACGALAVAAVVALFRWASRRDARHAAERPFLRARVVPGMVTENRDFLPPSAPHRELPFRDLHIHLDGVPAEAQAAVIRRALGGS